MKLNRVILAALCAAACQRTDAPPSDAAERVVPDTTVLVILDRPTVIGFFPPANDSAEPAEDGYVEGVAHLGFALQDAEACLGRDSARVVLVIDTAVRVQRGARIDTIRFSRIDSLSFGIYLLAPLMEPHLISVDGPSQLIPAVVETIPAYFKRRCDTK